MQSSLPVQSRYNGLKSLYRIRQNEKEFSSGSCTIQEQRVSNASVKTSLKRHPPLPYLPCFWEEDPNHNQSPGWQALCWQRVLVFTQWVSKGWRRRHRTRGRLLWKFVLALECSDEHIGCNCRAVGQSSPNRDQSLTFVQELFLFFLIIYDRILVLEIICFQIFSFYQRPCSLHFLAACW